MMTREERKAHIAALCSGTSGLIYKKRDLSVTRSLHAKTRVQVVPDVEVVPAPGKDRKQGRPVSQSDEASWSALKVWHDSVVFLSDGNKLWALYNADMPVFKLTFMRGAKVLGLGPTRLEKFRGAYHHVVTVPAGSSHVTAEDQSTGLTIKRLINNVKFIG